MIWINTYDLFTGEDLKVAELIQQRRLQLLVHSCIYYELDTNIISDKQWDEWARELVVLQEKYPYISSKLMWAEAFKGWDASTGAFLPLKDEWVMNRARRMVSKKRAPKKVEPVKPAVKTKAAGMLF